MKRSRRGRKKGVRKGSEKGEEERASLPTLKGKPCEASEDLEVEEIDFFFWKIEEGEPPTAMQGGNSH